ncbi:DUF3592 domain-containing protein [Streptomyces sp. NPDC006197]|uniref:DUF3592 domain-containing protein n=1 Tax=Streptomyces sp. NPDC006197 TaxID=3156685 RepID=UPI0033BEB0C5
MTGRTALIVFFILVFGWVFVAALYEIWRRLLLRIRGRRVLAEIVRFETHEDTEGVPHHHPVVSFTLQDGTRATAESPTGTPHTRAGWTGDRIEIVYDPRRPKTIAVPSLDPGHTGLGTIVVMVLLAAAAAKAVVTLALEIAS